MKRTLLPLLAATAIGLAIPAVAGAQTWMSMNQREAQLDQRIDAGVRSGQLTRTEAARLRDEFQDVVRLEARYRIDGLSMNERADLDRRFDALEARVYAERRDDDRRYGNRDGDWQNINQREAQLDQRIDAGVRSGRLTPNEAARLRVDFQDVVRLEARYRVDGLSMNERADLDRRFDLLENQIMAERRDGDRRYADRDRDRDDDRYGREDRYDYDNWQNLGQRQARFEQRLNQAVRDRRLTTTQARNLRLEFNRIVQIERQYRRGGLTAAERADLDARMDRVQLSFRQSVNANQYGYGYGQAPNLFDYIFGIR